MYSLYLYLFLTDNREEYFLQARLFFNIFHLCGREQLFKLRECPVGDDPALMQNGNSIGKLFSLVQILCGQEYRRAIIGKLFDNLPNLDARLGVKPGGWLVKKNDLRFSYKTHGDVEPAAHPARISRNPAVGSLGEAEAIQKIVRDLTRIFEVPQFGDHDQIFSPCQNFVHS